MSHYLCELLIVTQCGPAEMASRFKALAEGLGSVMSTHIDPVIGDLMPPSGPSEHCTCMAHRHEGKFPIHIGKINTTF